jgi:antitoxin FitA
VAQLVVRNLEGAVKTRLQLRAQRNGRSMEEEVRDILRSAAVEETAAGSGLGQEIASLFTKVGLESNIPEFRGHQIKPLDFE